MPLSCKAMPWRTLQLPVFAKAGDLRSTAASSVVCVCTYNERDCLPYCLAQWRALLGARSSIGELKLTAAARSIGQFKLTAGASAVLSGIDSHLNPLTCIPAGCNGLALGGHFAPFLGDYTEQSVTLQHLADRCGTDSWTSGADLLENLESLSHITQLRSLKVEVPGTVSGLAGLGNLPNLLTCLHIGGWEKVAIVIVLPELGCSSKAKCLRRLKHLQFHMCSVHISAGSILNLKGLTSLSLHQCGVGSRLDAVSQLTSLECLDLTGIRAQILGSEEWQPWRRFEAWPALSVFKFAGSCLIDHSTVLHIASVQEVHTDRLAVGMDNANVHLVLQDKHSAVFDTLSSLLVSGWPTHLVALHVTVTDWRDQALHLADVVNQVLGALLCLQSFHLVEGPHNPFHLLGRRNPQEQPVDYRPGQIVLGDDYSGELKDLKLQYLHFHTLDLGVATCLTSISLRNIEQPGVSCELSLPSSVVRLEVFGNGLTSQCLPNLTHFTLGITPKCMPTMPSSLRWLNVTSRYLKKLLDDSADCLRFCTNLEYLILPFDMYPEGELCAWVKSARCVSISHNDPVVYGH